MRGATPDSPWGQPARTRATRSSDPHRSLGKRILTGLALAVGVVVVILIVWVGMGVGEVWDRAWLEQHGVQAEATVVRVFTEDGGGEGGATTHAVVEIPACACEATVHVGSDQHPVGSKLLVWYDPNDPTHAEAAEDVGSEGVVWLMAVLLTLVWILVSTIRHRRSVRAWGGQARLHGFTYERLPEPFDEASAPLSLGPGNRSYRYALAGRWHGLDVDCRTCRVTKGKGESAKTTSAFAVSMQMEPAPPMIWIGSKNQRKTIGNAGFGMEVPLPPGVLPEDVVLWCVNERFARLAVSPVGAVLKETPKTSVEVHGGRLFFFPGKIKPVQLDEALERLSRLERGLRSALAESELAEPRPPA